MAKITVQNTQETVVTIMLAVLPLTCSIEKVKPGNVAIGTIIYGGREWEIAHSRPICLKKLLKI